MNTANLAKGIALVINDGVSINSAAKQAGVAISTLRLAVVTHPDYVKAKAEGKLKAAPNTAGRDIEQLKVHPAVLAVVQDGMTFEAAGLRFDVGYSTLNRWVHAAFPEFRNDSDQPRGRKTNDERAEPYIAILLNEIRDYAQRSGISADKLLKMTAKRLEEAA